MPDTPRPTPLEVLIDLLALERTGATTYRGRTGPALPEPYSRLFGGLIAAQSVRAAQATVEGDRHAHSLHGYFLAPGVAGDPVDMDVDPLRDGRSFSTRRVVARQHGQPIFTLVASFQTDEEGAQYQLPAPPAPDPEDPGVEWEDRRRPPYPPGEVFEYRYAPLPRLHEQGPYPTAMRFWARTVSPMPDDRALHACVLAYLSDLSGLTASALAVGLDWSRMRAASLDHSVHFHRPIRLDEWVVVEMCPVSNGGGRGLVRNTIHTRDGVLGASVTQEAMIRATGKR